MFVFLWYSPGMSISQFLCFLTSLSPSHLVCFTHHTKRCSQFSHSPIYSIGQVGFLSCYMYVPWWECMKACSGNSMSVLWCATFLLSHRHFFRSIYAYHLPYFYGDCTVYVRAKNMLPWQNRWSNAMKTKCCELHYTLYEVSRKEKTWAVKGHPNLSPFFYTNNGRFSSNTPTHCSNRTRLVLHYCFDSIYLV